MPWQPASVLFPRLPWASLACVQHGEGQWCSDLGPRRDTCPSLASPAAPSPTTSQLCSDAPSVESGPAGPSGCSTGPLGGPRPRMGSCTQLGTGMASPGSVAADRGPRPGCCATPRVRQRRPCDTAPARPLLSCRLLPCSAPSALPVAGGLPTGEPGLQAGSRAPWAQPSSSSSDLEGGEPGSHVLGFAQSGVPSGEGQLLLASP